MHANSTSARLLADNHQPVAATRIHLRRETDRNGSAGERAISPIRRQLSAAFMRARYELEFIGWVLKLFRRGAFPN
jgi:hypothetical protein